MFSGLRKTSSRQREIAEVVLRNGWDYMRRLLLLGKAEEPKLPPPAILRNILVELGPVYVKLGQLLSTRPDLLPPAYIEELTALQAEVPPVAWEAVEIVIRQQLRQTLESTFTTIIPQPVAAGSIAQTHRATLTDGREVALKIQRPGIDAVVEQDITLLRGLAQLVSRTEFGRYYDLVSLAEEFAAALRAELNFSQEASYTDQLRRGLATSRWFDPKRLVVPEIYWDLTTEKLLVMEWLNGVPLLMAKLDGAPLSKEAVTERHGISSLLVRAFFQQIYINGVFHADPHPGNLFYLEDGRIALIDCGMVGSLDPRTQRILTELLLAIVNLDAQRCSQLTLQLADSSQPVDLARLESDLNRLLRRYYNLNLAQVNFSQLIYEVLQAARKNKIRLPGNMGLYAKTVANLEGVARKLDPDFNLFDQAKPLMADLFRRQLVGEAPLQDLLRTALDLKNLSLDFPRQVELLLNRVTSETLQWNVTLRDIEPLRRSLDGSANRLSFSIVVAALIIGAATIFAQDPSNQLLFWVSGILFLTASLFGFWLLVSMLRAGRLRQ
ncbi:MAG TPA: AarF/ABC1/UbiB kinase family protein [Candidatus Caenarcaniphilales bacterium]